MYYNLCRSQRGPDEPSKEKDTYKPSKTVAREHEGAQFIICYYNIKGLQANIQKVRKLDLKGIPRHFTLS